MLVCLRKVQGSLPGCKLSFARCTRRSKKQVLLDLSVPSLDNVLYIQSRHLHRRTLPNYICGLAHYRTRNANQHRISGDLACLRVCLCAAPSCQLVAPMVCGPCLLGHLHRTAPHRAAPVQFNSVLGQRVDGTWMDTAGYLSISLPRHTTCICKVDPIIDIYV